MVVGAAIGVSTTIATSYANGVSPWTGEKLGSISNVRQELQYDTKQIGKKYGEHMKDYPGISHNEYLNLAKKIYSDPLSNKITYSPNALMYSGETHYYNGGNLLRIAPDGTCRSLYPYK